LFSFWESPGASKKVLFSSSFSHSSHAFPCMP
jgi:hypothetical protein